MRRGGRTGERVSALDATNLLVEAHGAPMHVAALALLDGGQLLEPGTATVRVDAVRAHVAERLPVRLRQRLVVPPRGRPYWAPPSAVDLAEHVRDLQVPAPGDEAALLALCCRLNERPLDRRRPLWELWLLTGLPAGQAGLLVRLHHVIADGVAALELLGSFFDPAPAAPAPVEQFGPGHAPDVRRGADAGRLGSAVPPATGHAPYVRRGADLGVGGAAKLAIGGATVERRAAGRAGEARRLVAARAAQLVGLVRAGRAPATPFNRPVGGRTRIVLVRADLARTRSVAHAHGGKVNDVVLTAVAGGARRLLTERGLSTQDLTLRVSVITSLRPPAPGRGASGAPPSSGGAGPRGTPTVSGNRTGVRVVPVDVGEPDPDRRLDRVVAVTTAQRSTPPMQPGGRLLRRWMVAVMRRQRMVNLILSNLPGPAAALTFAGAPVREMFQLGQNQGNVGISVGVLSYAGTLGIDVVVDERLVPDVGTFAAGVVETLDALGAR